MLTKVKGAAGTPGEDDVRHMDWAVAAAGAQPERGRVVLEPTDPADADRTFDNAGWARQKAIASCAGVTPNPSAIRRISGSAARILVTDGRRRASPSTASGGKCPSGYV
ncbi:hypothetical protein BZB76_2748 [Actinomadura pelletieri DSM 43383]|uniref:Uncharacterized protein n=1 Tax=Actinomadura pelletieri DSM 43383 TaxID=1120940 RepID=A0A495QMT7_9ACTN|nr:hypothetical protein [Actinomadura pelletieri]RKS74239.1 hypothetical protein BZB76_2748 [Actinomadura pelletieri DSM 43383]